MRYHRIKRRKRKIQISSDSDLDLDLDLEMNMQCSYNTCITDPAPHEKKKSVNTTSPNGSNRAK